MTYTEKDTLAERIRSTHYAVCADMIMSAGRDGAWTWHWHLRDQWRPWGRELTVSWSDGTKVWSRA